MEIIAHGIDLVDFGRIESMIQRHGGRFLNRIFTSREQSDAEAVHNNIEKLAGRFAAKEAVLKLIGTGWRGKIKWTDIEIINSPMGQPVVTITGEVKKIGILPVWEILIPISQHLIAGMNYCYRILFDLRR